MLGKFGLIVALIVAVVQATELTLRDKITQSLEQMLASEVEAQGVENCENKCDKVFNRFAYAVSVAGQPTYEFQACVAGCSQCTTDLSAGANAANCFKYCKDRDWHADGIFKGVIEPDKACIGGCVVQTCQVACMGGSPLPLSKKTKPLYYPNGGCTIKTEPYSQNLEYVSWNSPNTGQGGSEEVAQCCANALSLCEYLGNKDTTNYRVLLQKTGQYCKDNVPSGTEQAICAFFRNPANCGSATV